MTPFLSIVVTGRNDGYGGDFNGRFLRTLAFNHDRLREHGVEHEFVIYPREGHAIQERNHQLDVLLRTRAWFDRWLWS